MEIVLKNNHGLEYIYVKYVQVFKLVLSSVIYLIFET